MTLFIRTFKMYEAIPDVPERRILRKDKYIHPWSKCKDLPVKGKLQDPEAGSPWGRRGRGTLRESFLGDTGI